MTPLATVFLALAFVFAIFAAFSWPVVGRVQWGWLAMVFFFACLLLGGPLNQLLLRG